MSNLIDPLHQLQSAFNQLAEKYRFVTSELARIKAQPTIPPELLDELQKELSFAKEQGQRLEDQFSDQQEQLQDFEQRYQSLAESHSLISAEYEEAQAQIHTLTQANHKLQEKNRIAAEHTKLVLERLAKIDSEA